MSIAFHPVGGGRQLNDDGVNARLAGREDACHGSSAKYLIVKQWQYSHNTFITHENMMPC